MKQVKKLIRILLLVMASLQEKVREQGEMRVKDIDAQISESQEKIKTALYLHANLLPMRVRGGNDTTDILTARGKIECGHLNAAAHKLSKAGVEGFTFSYNERITWTGMLECQINATWQDRVGGLDAFEEYKSGKYKYRDGRQ